MCHPYDPLAVFLIFNINIIWLEILDNIFGGQEKRVLGRQMIITVYHCVKMCLGPLVKTAVSFHLLWDFIIVNEAILAQSKWGYEFRCHHKCPLFHSQPHSFLLLQQCPNNPTLPPPVSQNLILLLVPSSQSMVRVCLTNSALLLSLPFHPSVLLHPCSPQGLAKDLCSD